MPATNPNTVILKGPYVHKEGTVKAGVTITPGHLLERETDGTIKVHGVAAGNAAKMFAIENAMMGKGITDTYAAADNILFGIFAPGAEVYALVAAAAAAIVIGNYVESAGDGTVRVLTNAASTPEESRASVIGRALEAVDNSGGGAAVRIRIEVI